MKVGMDRIVEALAERMKTERDPSMQNCFAQAVVALTEAMAMDRKRLLGVLEKDEQEDG